MYIELIKPHTHVGKRHAVCERLELNDASARWLIAQGVAKTAAAPAAATADSKPTRRDIAPGTTTSQGG